MTATDSASAVTWPTTLDTAVNYLLGTLSNDQKTMFRNMPTDQLIQFHHGWGRHIRNELGLWRGNVELMAACAASNPDEASTTIIQAVWQQLQTM